MPFWVNNMIIIELARIAIIFLVLHSAILISQAAIPHSIIQRR